MLSNDASCYEYPPESSSHPRTGQFVSVGNGLTRHSSVSSDLSTLSIVSEDDSGDKTANGVVKHKGKTEPGRNSKKRSRDSHTTVVRHMPTAKKSKAEGDGKTKERGTYCHQCRTKQEPNSVLRCTRLKQFTKNGSPRACNLAWCDRDLAKRYFTDASAVRAEGWANNNMTPEGHNRAAGYLFTCPCCLDICQNSSCRKKRGLEPLGSGLKGLRGAGSDQRHRDMGKPLQVDMSAPNEPRTNSEPLTHLQPADSSTIYLVDSSELSELDSPAPIGKLKKGKSSQTHTKPQAGKVKASQKQTPKKGENSIAQRSVARRLEGMPKRKLKEGKRMSKAKNGEVVKRHRAKPVKHLQILVEPPGFEKVDTRLGREEAEQRMALREYLTRFRLVLGFPERFLRALDDFDRPLTEASVRLFAGAMIDLIQDELEVSGNDDDLIETIERNREELRYYADLARFCHIFGALSDPLHLSLPPVAAASHHRRDANAAAFRALLDLDSDHSGPTWEAKVEGNASRRAAASRIPQPSEVVRMLLALADRTMSTPKLRADIDSTTGENEERRSHAAALKKEVTSWEASKKKLAEARLQCKTAAETKSNKETTNRRQREHDLQVALINVNLRASLGRQMLRYEPLGVDFDGRVYYALTPRPIDDDGRAPFGWASVLLVWGIGVPRRAEEAIDEDELPMNVKRWSHFGKSGPVKQLTKWIEWRMKKAVTTTKPVKSPARPKATPDCKATAKSSSVATGSASRLLQSTLQMTTPAPALLPRSVNQLEVVMPISTKKAASSDSSLSSISSSPSQDVVKAIVTEREGDNTSDISSDLSIPPISTNEGLLALLHPKEYKPSAATVAEEGKELVRRLSEVGEWLEVLEWRGMGLVD